MKRFGNLVLIWSGILMAGEASTALAESPKIGESEPIQHSSEPLTVSDAWATEVSDMSEYTEVPRSGDISETEAPTTDASTETSDTGIPIPINPIDIEVPLPDNSTEDTEQQDTLVDRELPETDSSTTTVPTIDSDTKDTDSDTEALDTETADTEASDTETADTETADTETADTEVEKEETTTAVDANENDLEAEAEELSPEELAKQQKLIEADRLYLSGDIIGAEQLYREAKNPFDNPEPVQKLPEPIYETTQLSPAGGVYWRNYESGLEKNLESKILIPLKFLVEQQPEFIPGHIRYAKALKDYERLDEALVVLTQAKNLYPNEPELIKVTMAMLADSENWFEASLVAREFALFNTEHPQSEEFLQLADQHLDRHISHLRNEITGNTIMNVITGTLGYVFTGNLFGPLSAIESTVLMLQGESGIGKRIAKQAQKQLPMLEDEEVLEYVREMGNELTKVTGRDEFNYEFYVVMDDQLNAFALPGGKIFINAGAILKTKSEAELAGLLAHELSHAVLSHGFQLVTQGNLTANITQFIPYGGTAANLIVLNYSRNMERQADDLGTKILAASGYAADGLRNLMITLHDQGGPKPLFPWLSTHPETKERINNLEAIIDRNGYNRYTYEGVEKHLEIQKRVAELLKEYEEKQKEEEEGKQEGKQEDDQDKTQKEEQELKQEDEQKQLQQE
ncbi:MULTISPECIES: M48 family metallopeptidase [unclassified Moorena]|uniref:M48 family metallopeptidase n=1 Tax=unclassified Moorena TaxID=2683338 RepID=UPI0013CAE91D|nr:MULTISPECIES: M48 family metallopeptidase [unclassified Moorena]NEO23007.1 M48 family metalloprotease [Moorena sp. SIO4A5]NEQ61951.1 M48 family metalloprotease [Moorena sp. SIO4A1]